MMFLIELARTLLLIIGCLFLFIFATLLIIIGVYVIFSIIKGLLKRE